MMLSGPELVVYRPRYTDGVFAARHISRAGKKTAARDTHSAGDANLVAATILLGPEPIKGLRPP
jgi:hypothetical protein